MLDFGESAPWLAPLGLDAPRRPYVGLCAVAPLARLRVLELIKKVAHAYRYYLTGLGHSAIAAACPITCFNIVPAMAATH